MMMSNENKMDWVCPTDRELALRAQLRLGWSIHTQHMYRRAEPLQEFEQRLIQHVIDRAQKIQSFENQRVCRMVERLTNMKKNTVGDGQKCCSMCACRFGRFNDLYFFCRDCSKAVCNKCCVDTVSVAHEPCMLCKICSESRELWKKSGGWFYKCLPLSPSHQNSGEIISESPNKSYSTWTHRTPEMVRLQSFEPPDELNTSNRIHVSNWALNDAETLSKSTESLDDQIALQPLHASVMDIRKENSMQLLAVPGDETNLDKMAPLSISCPSLCPIDKPQTDIGTVSFSLIYNPTGRVLQCTVYNFESPELEDSRTKRCYIKVHLLPVTKKTSIVKTKTLERYEDTQFNETMVFPKIKYDELTRKLLRLLVLEEDPFKDEVLGEIIVSLNDIRVMESHFFKKELRQPNQISKGSSDRGWIFLSLLYFPERESFIINVVCCSDLSRRNKIMTRELILKAEIIPGPDPMKRRVSLKCHSTNPTFNEEFTFKLDQFSLKKQSIKISVWEKTGLKFSTCIGHVTIGMRAKDSMLQHWLETLKHPGRKTERWHPLKRGLQGTNDK